MKQLYIIAILVILSFPAGAQEKWIYATLMEHSSFDQKLKGGDTTTAINTVNDGFRIMPVLGAGYFLDKRTGVGVEVGYARAAFNGGLNADRGTETEHQLREELHKSFYISPTLFQAYDFNRFRLTTMLKIPVQRTVQSITDVSYSIRKSTNEIVGKSEQVQSLPIRWKYGIQTVLNFQCRIVKRLYAGPQLSFGWAYDLMKGDLVITRTGTSQGQTTREEAKQNIRVENSAFSVQPSFIISYYL